LSRFEFKIEFETNIYIDIFAPDGISRLCFKLVLFTFSKPRKRVKRKTGSHWIFRASNVYNLLSTPLHQTLLDNCFLIHICRMKLMEQFGARLMPHNLVPSSQGVGVNFTPDIGNCKWWSTWLLIILS